MSNNEELFDGVITKFMNNNEKFDSIEQLDAYIENALKEFDSHGLSLHGKLREDVIKAVKVKLIEKVGMHNK